MAAGLVALPAHVYHIAEESNWESIQRDGLLSTTMLLDRANVQGSSREALVEEQRKDEHVLPDGVVIRDQKPLSAAALERCLVGMTPAEWYALLNAKVFFWFSVERLNRMRLVYEQTPQVVLTVDVALLLARHSAAVSFSPFNSGNARRAPARRGRSTFVPYEEWLRSGWAAETSAVGSRPRPRGHLPVELTVENAVPDILAMTTDVRELDPGRLFTP